MGRDPNHDYRSKGYYHITIRKAPGLSNFSRVRPIFDSKNQLIDAKVNYYPAGAIIRNQLFKINDIPGLRMEQYKVMPDHIHFLLHVLEYLDEPIGVHISRFKIQTLQAIRKLNPTTASIFEPDYHDRILRKSHSLNVIFNYIKTNPYRLAERHLHPEYFQRVNSWIFDHEEWQIYGNIQLLENPFKYNVVIHRADSRDVKNNKYLQALYYSQNGGVVVSPFIAEDEKIVRDACFKANGKIILIRLEGFPEIYKPSGRLFDHCKLGRLLVIAPKETLQRTRQNCLRLNALAERLSK